MADPDTKAAATAYAQALPKGGETSSHRALRVEAADGAVALVWDGNRLLIPDETFGRICDWYRQTKAAPTKARGEISAYTHVHPGL